MKKLLITLASFSFIAPASAFVVESYSMNRNIGSNENVSPKFVDLKNDYFSGNTLTGMNFESIENVENAGKLGDITGQLTFGYKENEVYIIKTNVDGKVVTEKFFTANNNIYAMIGRGKSLILFTEQNIISFDFSLKFDFIGKSANENWFQTQTENNIDQSFGKVMNFTDYFGPDTNANSENIFVLPQRNNIVVNGGRLTSEVYDISDVDGTVTKNESVGNFLLKGSELITDAYSFFFTGSNEETRTYWIAGKVVGSTNAYGILNTNSGSIFSPEITIVDNQEEKEKFLVKDNPIQTFDLGKVFGIGAGTHVFMWNETSHGNPSDGSMRFDLKDSIFDSKDFEDDESPVTYVTGAIDPNGHTAVMIGTEKGQYILRTNDSEGSRLGENGADITKDSFTEIDQISNTETSAALHSYSSAMTNSYGKIYVLDGSGNVHMWQHKVFTGTSAENSEDSKTIKFESISDLSNLEKAEAIRDQIEEASFNGSSTGSYVSLNDVVGALEKQYKTNNLDDISQLTDFKENEGELKQLSIDKSSVKWFETSFNFQVGTDKSLEVLEQVLSNLTVDSPIQFNAKLDAIMKPLQDVADTALDNLIKDHSDWKGKVSIQVLDITLPNGNGDFLEIGSNQYSISAKLKSANGIEETYTDGKATFTNVRKVDLGIANNLSTSKSTSWTIGNLSDVLNYKEGSSISATISSATGIPNNKNDNKENNFSLKAFDASTGEQLDPETLAKYVSVEIVGDQLKVNYTNTRYDGSIDLTLSIDTSNAEAANSVGDISIHISFPVPASINWALIGGIIGGVVGAGLLGFLIFAFIKWWMPVLLTSRGASRQRKSSKSYSRVPQERADKNSYRHARQHHIKKASAYNDKKIERSGIFAREIDVNEEKFKNPNRKSRQLGFDLDDEAVVNHWSGVHEGENAKRPKISFTQKSKTEAHEKEVTEMMRKKKAELEKAAKAKAKEKAKADKENSKK
jgi:hypothetical protein